MNLVREICDAVLLLYIECTLINTVCGNSITELSTCHMMKNQSVLSCVDHCSVVEFFKLIRKLSLVS